MYLLFLWPMDMRMTHGITYLSMAMDHGQFLGNPPFKFCRVGQGRTTETEHYHNPPLACSSSTLIIAPDMPYWYKKTAANGNQSWPHCLPMVQDFVQLDRVPMTSWLMPRTISSYTGEEGYIPKRSHCMLIVWYFGISNSWFPLWTPKLAEL